MVIFNHIPRTAGTFIQQRIRESAFAGGPMIRFPGQGRTAPLIACDRRYRPVMMTFHMPGREFERRYARQSSDFVFAFLRDRVDMEYSNFAYMKMRVLRKDPLGPFEQGAEYYLRSLEAHVDELLASDAEDRQYPARLATYDFVGIAEEMPRSLAILNAVLGVALQDDATINSVPTAKDYRRPELEARFAPQREMYLEARERVRGRGYDHLLAQPRERAGAGHRGAPR